MEHLKLQAAPALERLTSVANMPNLERVRKIKTMHQQLVNRVSSMREEIKNLMGGCLTRGAAPGLAWPALAGLPWPGLTWGWGYLGYVFRRSGMLMWVQVCGRGGREVENLMCVCM